MAAMCSRCGLEPKAKNSNSWCLACKRSYQLAKIAENPERYKRAKRERELKQQYGITIEQYNELLAEQGGVCAVCRGTNSDRRLAVDHDHRTGQIRGLLCYHCNMAAGYLRDSVEFAAAMSHYLAKARAFSS